MKLTKQQIRKIKTALKQAEKAENVLSGAIGKLASVIIESTGINGNVDNLLWDGFGFTPISNDLTHISIEQIIKMAENGEDITEELILNNLSI